MIWGVLQFPGSCDERDALNACEIAGGGAPTRPVLSGMRRPTCRGLDGIVVPGGFSYGDYLRAGAIARFAPAMTAVADFAAAGGPVLGICNGFQVLCESGLLPGALLTNERTRFICRQGDLVVGEADSPFLSGLEAGQTISIPFKHQSGRFFAPPEMLEQIESNNQVAFRYADGPQPERLPERHRRRDQRSRQRARPDASPRACGRRFQRFDRRTGDLPGSRPRRRRSGRMSDPKPHTRSA